MIPLAWLKAQDFSDDVFFPQPSLTVIESRIKELKAKEGQFPDNDSIFNVEVQTLESELSRYKGALTSIDQRSQEPNPWNGKKKETEDLFQSVDKLKCDSLKGQDVRDDLGHLADIRKGLVSAFGGSSFENPWESSAFNIKESTDATMCRELKAALAEPKRASLLKKIDENGTAYQKRLADDAIKRERIKELVSAIQNRLDQMDKRVSKEKTKKDLTSYLFALVAIIGSLGILTLLSIKLFPEQQQLEWITSGQVVQFVTVMILLSVVMALGLVDILHENTIGTILGGIGGYVLSQGVGRAAAREVSRAVGSASQPPRSGQ